MGILGLEKRKGKVSPGDSSRHKLVPGRYGIWVKMVDLGETSSPISSQEKGLPLS